MCWTFVVQHFSWYFWQYSFPFSHTCTRSIWEGKTVLPSVVTPLRLPLSMTQLWHHRVWTKKKTFIHITNKTVILDIIWAPHSSFYIKDITVRSLHPVYSFMFYILLPPHSTADGTLQCWVYLSLYRVNHIPEIIIIPVPARTSTHAGLLLSSCLAY